MFKCKEQNDIKYLELSEFVNEGIKAFFTTRIGGISNGNYTSLNMGLHTDDIPQNVIKNRKKFCETVDINFKNLIAGEQIHGDKVYVVKPEDKGRGAENQQTCITGVDALITDCPGLPLISFYADCVPLYIFDPVLKAVGLAHAGWKGTVLKTGLKTIKKMKNVYGTCPQDCLIGIGPSISRSNYLVDNRVVYQYKNQFSDWTQSDLSQIITSVAENQYFLDLKLANRILFEKAGIPHSQIFVSNYCTYQHSQLFYSYRKNPVTGRMISIIEI